MDHTRNTLPEFWISVLVYFLVVELFMLFTEPSLLLNTQILMTRLIFLIVFSVLYFLRRKISSASFVLISLISVYALLTLLYKETSILNQLFFRKIDPFLMAADQAIFGMQPALEFSVYCNNMFFSELMFSGYFFYYLMPLLVIAIIYQFYPSKMNDFAFMLITSFLLYYLIFIILPAEGPQFYFPFPENYIEAKGIFGQTIKQIQYSGEAPTAAFPSSHVGISLIVLIWLWKNAKKWFPYFLPFTLILMFSTVYLKAHYAVDVIAGIITAPLIFTLSSGFLNCIKLKHSHENHH